MVKSHPQQRLGDRDAIILNDYISKKQLPDPWEIHSWIVDTFKEQLSKVNALRSRNSGASDQQETYVKFGKAEGNINTILVSA